MRLALIAAVALAATAALAAPRDDAPTRIDQPGAVIKGATVCEDALPFAECYTVKTDLRAHVVSVDPVGNVRVVLFGHHRYVTGPDEAYVMTPRGDVTVTRYLAKREYK